MDCKIIKILILLIFLPTKTLAIEFEGNFKQGSFILGKAKPGDRVKFLVKVNFKLTKKKFLKENIRYNELTVFPKKKLHPRRKSMKELKKKTN